MYTLAINKYIGLGILLGTMMLFSYQGFIELHDIVPHGWVAFIVHAVLLIVAGFLLYDKSWTIKRIHATVSFFPAMYIGLLAVTIVLVSIYHPSNPVIPSINPNIFPVSSLLTLLLLPFGLSYAFISHQIADAGLSRRSIAVSRLLLFCLWLILYPLFHLIAISLVSLIT